MNKLGVYKMQSHITQINYFIKVSINKVFKTARAVTIKNNVIENNVKDTL